MPSQQMKIEIRAYMADPSKLARSASSEKATISTERAQTEAPATEQTAFTSTTSRKEPSIKKIHYQKAEEAHPLTDTSALAKKTTMEILQPSSNRYRSNSKLKQNLSKLKQTDSKEHSRRAT